jgi:hypothetical protein
MFICEKNFSQIRLIRFVLIMKATSEGREPGGGRTCKLKQIREGGPMSPLSVGLRLVLAVGDAPLDALTGRW